MHGMRTLAPAAALAVVAGSASADLIIGNLGAPGSSSTLFGTGSTTLFKAVGFTMGADAYFLDSVTLALDMGTGEGNPVVSIWSGNSAPTNPLFTLTNPASLGGGGVGDFVFTADSAFTLDANTTYWVHVISDPQDGDNFNWLATTTANPPAGPAAAFVSYNFNGSSSSFYNRFEINGRVVPTPGALAMLGAAGLLAGRRRR